MNPALLIKLRPTGPWRIGPDSGARNQVDAIYHSDTLYASVTSAMLRLGRLHEWLLCRNTDRVYGAGSMPPCWHLRSIDGAVLEPASAQRNRLQRR